MSDLSAVSHLALHDGYGFDKYVISSYMTESRLGATHRRLIIICNVIRLYTTRVLE